MILISAVPAEDGNVLKVLPHHSLLRVIRQSGDWLEAESDGVDGFIYAPYTGAGSRDELTQEDFALGYAALGQKFDEQEAEERLGAVKQEKIDKKRKQINYTFDGAVISVARKKQAVEAIRVVDPKYITMRGVSIGDSAGRAVGQYGLPVRLFMLPIIPPTNIFGRMTRSSRCVLRWKLTSRAV